MKVWSAPVELPTWLVFRNQKPGGVGAPMLQIVSDPKVAKSASEIRNGWSEGVASDA